MKKRRKKKDQRNGGYKETRVRYTVAVTSLSLTVNKTRNVNKVINSLLITDSVTYYQLVFERASRSEL